MNFFASHTHSGYLGLGGLLRIVGPERLAAETGDAISALMREVSAGTDLSVGDNPRKLVVGSRQEVLEGSQVGTAGDGVAELVLEGSDCQTQGYLEETAGSTAVDSALKWVLR